MTKKIFSSRREVTSIISYSLQNAPLSKKRKNESDNANWLGRMKRHVNATLMSQPLRSMRESRQVEGCASRATRHFLFQKDSTFSNTFKRFRVSSTTRFLPGACERAALNEFSVDRAKEPRHTAIHRPLFSINKLHGSTSYFFVAPPCQRGLSGRIVTRQLFTIQRKIYHRIDSPRRAIGLIFELRCRTRAASFVAPFHFRPFRFRCLLNR